ncbi:MAG TPA: biotin--[acetyl-CoA-carboxylase] ligase [Flavobacteriales bacterium]|jgi:BirA family biotin operon repressor/biotin-[acetyl-CoA-carboxylase] ligase|nr:biotin--[acetyl-CoA-carboxylase] ligase [Flavobacteriales bacterium]
MHIYRLEHIASTNEYLMNLVRTGKVSEKTAIWTDNQTEGRGRNGNIWLTNRGNDLALSLYIPRIGLSVSRAYLLNVCAALGVSKALSAYVSGTETKWPNDVMIGDKKVGGILISNALQGTQIKDTVIGIGVNVNTMEFGEGLPYATSIARVGHVSVDIGKLAESIIHKTIQYIDIAHSEEFIMSEFNANLWKKNDFLQFRNNEQQFSARVLRVDILGNLWLEVDGELESFPQDELKTILPDF